jgi:dihydrodipicolinate synthase/N-acetylneuraminate lyase
MPIQKKYQGVVIPAVTPVRADRTLDKEAVERLLTFFRCNDVLPFILGTTGESASLPASIKHEYIQTAARAKQSGDVLYAGISSNNPDESVAMAHTCFEAGLDVVVATLPSYYALSAYQMTKYFEQLAEQVPGPLMIYNIPATTHMSIPLDVIDTLSHHENIVGVKDSERSDERLKASLDLWAKRTDFSYFLGWAARSAEALLNGGDGIIPSTGNFAPKLYADLFQAAVKGDKTTALKLQEESDSMGNIYQQGRLLGESLWALKVIMKQQGLCDPYMMPPLHELGFEEEQKVLNRIKETVKF